MKRTGTPGRELFSLIIKGPGVIGNPVSRFPQVPEHFCPGAVDHGIRL